MDYDGSLQSARAIQMFLMLRVWAHCETTIMTVSDDPTDGDGLLAAMQEYFASYAVEAAVVRAEGRPSDAILDQVQRTGADLLVMGAYGQKRLASFFLGSTTKAVVEDAGIPVFLYH